MRSPAEMMAMIERLKKEVASLKAQLLENGIEPRIDFQIKEEKPPPTTADVIDEPEKHTKPDDEEEKEQESKADATGEDSQAAKEDQPQILEGQEQEVKVIESAAEEKKAQSN